MLLGQNHLGGNEAIGGILRRKVLGAKNRPHYTTQYILRHQMHAFRITLGQFRVVLDRLQVKAKHQTTSKGEICQLFNLQETQTEDHFVFQCHIYYKIRGQFYYIFGESQNSLSLSIFFLIPRPEVFGFVYERGNGSLIFQVLNTPSTGHHLDYHILFFQLYQQTRALGDQHLATLFQQSPDSLDPRGSPTPL